MLFPILSPANILNIYEATMKEEVNNLKREMTRMRQDLDKANNHIYALKEEVDRLSSDMYVRSYSFEGLGRFGAINGTLKLAPKTAIEALLKHTGLEIKHEFGTKSRTYVEATPTFLQRWSKKLRGCA